MYSECSRFHPHRFTFGGVIAERVNTVFCPVEYFDYRLFEPITVSAANVIHCCFVDYTNDDDDDDDDVLSAGTHTGH